MATKLIRRQLKKQPGDRSNKHYSDKQKFEAVVSYMALGNMAVVSDVVGIPHDRLRQWKTQPWWKEIEAQIRAQKRVEVSSKLSKIIDKAARIVEDRLEHGDYKMDKNGTVHRVEVDAKVASEILTKSIDKQILLDKIEDAPEVKEEAVIDRLEAITKRLIEAAGIKRKLPEVIDVDPVRVE